MEPEPQAGEEPHAEPEPQAEPGVGGVGEPDPQRYMTFKNELKQGSFKYINYGNIVIYLKITDDNKLIAFSWSEFLPNTRWGSGMKAWGESAGKSVEARLEYFNSADFNRDYLQVLIEGDNLVIDLTGDNIFDFDIITDRGEDSERPTQYAWKMGNKCEDESIKGEHNAAAFVCGDPITGKQFVGDTVEYISGEKCSQKLDHAVHIIEESREDDNGLKLDNYKLLDDPLYEGGPIGTHPSDHSAICFNIIDSTTQPEGSALQTLISWNAEGFCSVLPFIVLRERITDFHNGKLTEDWGIKITEFEETINTETDSETLIARINNFYAELNTAFGGAVATILAAAFMGGLLVGVGAMGTGAVGVAASDKLIGKQVKPGGYWSSDDWSTYMIKFRENNCKILMIQELFLKDFLEKGEIREHMNTIVQYLSRYIITLLSGGGEDMDNWEYRWDGYTGCVFWDSSVYELSMVHSIIRGRYDQPPHHEEVWENSKQALEAGQKPSKYSTHFEFILEGTKKLNVTNIHLQASPSTELPHRKELRNIMDVIRSIITSKHHYLIGDFNIETIKNLMGQVMLDYFHRGNWEKGTAKALAEGSSAALVSAGGRGAAATGDVAGSFASGMTSLAQGFGLEWRRGGGKKHKSTRRKRKSTRRKHKKTHKKSKRKKSYKKKGKLKEK